jgi:hypothetical protein
MLLFELYQAFQSAYVSHTISTFGRKRMADDLVVPKVHIESELVIDALHIEGRHVTHDTLQWPVNLHFRQKKVRKYAVRITWLLVLVMLGTALNSCGFAAFVSIGIRENKSGIQADLSV